MNKRNRILVAAVALLIVGVSVGLFVLFRVQQTREFSQPHQVRTRGGTNYVVRLLEAAVGKADAGYVLIVYIRLENSNPFDITLHREGFMLVDGNKKYYMPSTSGTQRELIRLHANSVQEREMLSFTVPDDTLAGGIRLVVGQNDPVVVKDRTPFNVRLRDGEFLSFRRYSW